MDISMRQGFLLKGLQDLVAHLHAKGIGGTMVEIGSYKGESTRVFASHFDQVYAVDPWQQGYDVQDLASHTDMQMVESVFDRFTDHLKNVKKLKMTSRQACVRFEDRTLDFVYIDGVHQYKDVLEDIRLWKPRVKRSGYIGGHDYGFPQFKVTEAVNEAFGEPDRVFEDYSWIKKIP